MPTGVLARDMIDDESRANILQALYEASSVVKTYVDMVHEGHALPYTILMSDKQMEDNEMVVEKIKSEPFQTAMKWLLKDLEARNPELVGIELPKLIKSLIAKPAAPVKQWKVKMTKDNVLIAGSEQIVSSQKALNDLTSYAMYKGYNMQSEEIK